jgi:hypothetical protein
MFADEEIAAAFYFDTRKAMFDRFWLRKIRTYREFRVFTPNLVMATPEPWEARWWGNRRAGMIDDVFAALDVVETLADFREMSEAKTTETTGHIHISQMSPRR